MAIDTKNTGPLNAYQKLSDLAPQKAAYGKAAENDNITGVDNALKRVEGNISKAEMRVEQQASLVAHLFGDGEKTAQSSLKMTYQAAIEKINEILTADFATANADEGNQATPAPISLEKLQDQGGMEYWTPENTANRIVSGATGFFAGFQKAHPELEGEALINEFMDIVGGGLTQGFEEAKGILTDLNVLEGSIAANVDLTYQLVQEGMQTFKEEFLAGLANRMQSNDDSEVTLNETTEVKDS